MRRAIWARWILLGCYLVLTFVWYFATFSASDPIGFRLDPIPSEVGSFLIATAALFGVQFLLLLGAPHVHWPRPRRRRSIFVSLAAGSAIAMLLSIGIVTACASLYKLIHAPDSFHEDWVVTSMTPTTAPARPAPPPKFDWRSDIPWAIIGILLVAWTFWFLIFALVGGGQWTQRFSRMYRTLIAGTVLELLITIPVDVQVRRRTHCYCGEGTFYSLAIGLTAILWAFGPGVVILFLIRRHQRLAETGCCLQCGYNLRGLQNNRCPECGTAFGPLLG
jgi:hypothetical protein